MTFLRRCIVCQKNYADYDEWVAHLINEHIIRIINSGLKCNGCEKYFSSISEVFSHFEAAHSNVSICCSVCQAVWPDVSFFVDFCLGERERCPQCEMCSCVCGYTSDEEHEHSSIFDENDFLTKYCAKSNLQHEKK